MSAPLLEVRDLRVEFATERGSLRAVDRVSFAINRGEVVAIVGESGSGKSATALSLLGLSRGAATVGGSVQFDGIDLLGCDGPTLRSIRAARIAIIFQDAISALNPVYRVGDQVAEVITAHRKIAKKAARAKAVALLAEVGIPDPTLRARSYPHELSGGMRQRVMIAMAIALGPELLIADEPTTALDVTIQAQILALIRRTVDRGVAALLITHDLGVVAEIADRVLVMYGGRIVETGTVEQIFYEPRHPYTVGLLDSITRLDGPRRARLHQIDGQPPSPFELPSGCHFRTRCRYADAACEQVPKLRARNATPDHLDRCIQSTVSFSRG